MNPIFEQGSSTLTEEAKYVREVEKVSYDDFISNSVYLRSEYEKSLKEYFENLKNLWLEETKLSSNVFMTLSHPAHLNIIKLGKIILPYIFEDLSINKNHWFFALSSITGVNPVQSTSVGDLDKIKQDWLAWGRQENYID